MEPSMIDLGTRRPSLRGRDLRYFLAHHLWSLPPGASAKVAELVAAVQRHGFDLGARPTKTVSDALRWEIEHRRVRRIGWGRYESGVAPRQTRAWIRDRVRRVLDALRAIEPVPPTFANVAATFREADQKGRCNTGEIGGSRPSSGPESWWGAAPDRDQGLLA